MIKMIPKNPVTLAINGFLMDNYLRDFAEKNLPAYGYEITSAYRDEEKNREVGGVENSAHLYNLARDIVLTKNGIALNSAQLKQVYDQFIKPSWEGYSKLYHSHIHLNMDRELSEYTRFAGYAATAFIAAFGIKKFIKKYKENKK